MKERYIVHVDMDAFFASVEQRDNPKLIDRPVVIGADPKKGKGRGVVSTCSYQARKYGIHSAMPISIAYKKCPSAVFLPVDMNKYHKVSQQIYAVFYDFTPDIEPIGIDEAFLDITGSFHLFKTPKEACLQIKSRIKKELNLTASIGLAPTKMAAKIASDLEKPDGFVEVKKEKILDFLWPLSIDKIWGLGKKSQSALDTIGIKTIGDLARKDVEELIKLFGRNGLYFWKLAQGEDERRIDCDVDAKSISNEVTFEKDTLDTQQIESTLLWLCEKVSNRLRQENLKSKTITLKIRFKSFETYTRSITFNKATNFVDTLYEKIKNLYNKFNSKSRKIRLVGVKTSNFVPSDFPDDLFRESIEQKQERVHKATDEIKTKFGENSIHRAYAK